MNMTRGVTGYKIPQYESAKEEELLHLVLSVAQEQLICNLPTSKVIVFYSRKENEEGDPVVNFKIIGGEKPEDEDEEDEEVEEEQEDEEAENQE